MTNELPPLPGTPDSTEKILAVVSHLSGFIGLPFVLPLIVYLVKKGESAYVAENAREALNFHLTLLLALFIGGVLTVIGIGIVVIIAVIIAYFILSIIAAIRAVEGTIYRYPWCLRPV